MREPEETPNARSCFAESLIHWISNGVFAANVDKSASISFAFSPDQSMTVNESDACSNLSQRRSACVQSLKSQTPTAATPAINAHFQNIAQMVFHDCSAFCASHWSFCQSEVAQSQTAFMAFAAHCVKLPERAVRTLQNPEFISIQTCWNIFQRTDTSLSPVLTKFVNSLFACVICFLRISRSPHIFFARSESQTFIASARAFFTTFNCCLSCQRSTAIFIASGVLNLSISCSDCLSDFWSVSTMICAVSFSVAIFYG